MDILDPAVCEILLNDIRLPDGTLPDFDGGIDTPPHTPSCVPLFDRGRQVPRIRSRDMVTQVERVVTRDGGSQHALVGVHREVQTHIPRTVTWMQTLPPPLFSQRYVSDTGSTDGV